MLPHHQPYHIIFILSKSYSITSFLLSPHSCTSSYLTMSSLCHLHSALTSSYVSISSLPLYSYHISILPYHLILTIILTLLHHHTLSFQPTFFSQSSSYLVETSWCLREHHDIIDVMSMEVTTSSPLGVWSLKTCNP